MGYATANKRYTIYSNCHPNKSNLVISLGKLNVYAGGWTNGAGDGGIGIDLYIDLADTLDQTITLINPDPTLQKIISKYEASIIKLDWPDYGVPKFGANFWKDLSEYLKIKSREDQRFNLLIACTGGHGRTGTALSIISKLLKPRIKDPVAWIRNKYCRRAVESLSQLKYVETVLNIKLPSKSFSATKKQTGFIGGWDSYSGTPDYNEMGVPYKTSYSVQDTRSTPSTKGTIYGRWREKGYINLHELEDIKRADSGGDFSVLENEELWSKLRKYEVIKEEVNDLYDELVSRYLELDENVPPITEINIPSSQALMSRENLFSNVNHIPDRKLPNYWFEKELISLEEFKHLKEPEHFGDFSIIEDEIFWDSFKLSRKVEEYEINRFKAYLKYNNSVENDRDKPDNLPERWLRNDQINKEEYERLVFPFMNNDFRIIRDDKFWESLGSRNIDQTDIYKYFNYLDDLNKKDPPILSDGVDRSMLEKLPDKWLAAGLITQFEYDGLSVISPKSLEVCDNLMNLCYTDLPTSTLVELADYSEYLEETLKGGI